MSTTMTTPTTTPAASPTTHPFDLPAVNARLEGADPRQTIEWAAQQFGNGLVMSSSFGEQAIVLIHMAVQVKPDIRIIFVDTGYLFPETHQFMEKLRRRFNLNVWTYRTKNDPIAYLQKKGETDPTQRKDVEACCAANKNEPFERAFAELGPAAWLRGTRRDQNPVRKSFSPVDWFARYNCYAVSPILGWTGRDVGLYMKAHNLPYHPLVEQGYLSIGCNPLSCTRPVLPGEDPRAGRWSGKGKTECGLNLKGDVAFEI